MLNANQLAKGFKAVEKSYKPVVAVSKDPSYLKIHRPPPTFIECRCQFCDTLKWPLMYKLYDNKLDCWFEIPRSCSVTVKEIHPERKQIFRANPIYKELIENSKPIVVISDPIDRFISAINAYLVEVQRYWGYGQQIFASFGVNISEKTIQERVDLFFENVDKVKSDHQVHHFQPQVLFIDQKNFSDFTFVWKKDVCKFFGTEEVMNKTDRRITRENLSDKHIEFLKGYYKDDYAFIEKYGD